MNAPVHPIEHLHAELSDLDWITDEGRIARLSQDFSWFSPVLKRQLEDKRAQAVVRPRSEDEIRRLLASCARLRVPVTVRGSGTGNYGQSTPLQGGVVLDMSGYNAFLWARDGVARAQAGIRLSDLEKATRPLGWELRCLPSTWRSATLGGLFGGGFGGIGSINHGPLASRGNVLGAKAITFEEEPRLVELRGSEAMQLHHMWGTNGLVLELEIALAPCHDWTEQIVVFDTFEAALGFGDAVSRAAGIVKRELCVLSAPIPDLLRQLADHLPAGCHAAIVAVAPASEPALQETAAQFGGRVSYRRSAEEVRAGNRTLLEFTWNHTTLNALKVDRTLTYLQSAFTAGQHLEQVRRIDALLRGEVLMHVEFIRNIDGHMTCTALPLVRFTSEERLQEIMRLYRDNGVRINDPHVFIVEDGRAQGTLVDGAEAMKQRFDPHNLLNPGKVRAWGGGAPV
ncbi:MAG TPA: FAD-binding oxidoreductase [Ramlibacter sp.]|jgi:FAD/FMN-containing dehydrogenase|uniref:FAD-binding oxidoreductase n=1 Tax=Ramlibacter sp. TaxID=1917967 RepID=UPI002D6C45FC|nr:FAD-binding oxidoreductase [Ramlibacter sp.]HZY18260.1 FAD-binding oxidoreductase [Ramlibacter sp.]